MRGWGGGLTLGPGSGFLRLTHKENRIQLNMARCPLRKFDFKSMMQLFNIENMQSLNCRKEITFAIFVVVPSSSYPERRQ